MVGDKGDTAAKGENCSILAMANAYIEKNATYSLIYIRRSHEKVQTSCVDVVGHD